MQKDALAEDATIFQYDEVYDDIESKRKEAKLAKKSAAARQPKYITKLLVTAEKRKLENERRVERQVQKDREAEGEEFKDKESFVTSAYRKKLEEMKEAEELEKRETYLENIGDVTKQQDLSGFYRHIYEQKMSLEVKVEKKVDDGKKDEETVDEEGKKDEEIKVPETSKKKNYRKRKSSADQKEESENEDKESALVNPADKAHLPCNLDADSDFSIDSSDSEDEAKKQTEIKREKSPEVDATVALQNGEPEAVAEVKVEKEEPEEPPKPKIDIWKKRTVGAAFDEALKKFYERKAEREQAA